jgi:pimeloyl-ACP methyl ester carboxylesterase
VDPDAIFWSAKEGPLAEGLGPDRRDAFFDVSVDDEIIASTSLKRLAMAANVKVEKVTADGLVAELFMPEGATTTNKIPIVAFGGSEGGIGGGEMFAMRMASWGHPALAIAYFGTTGVPSELSEIPLEYFGKAFAYLDTRPETRKGKAIVIGGSRGGELALLLGATFPNVVAGVIAETPSSFRWAGLGTNIGDAKPAWTFEGKPLAFVPDSAGSQLKIDTVKTPKGTTAYVLRPMFERAMTDAKPEALEAARIRVEEISGPILMLAGSDDQMWPACDFVERAMTQLTTSGHVAKHADEGVCFPGAGHDVGSVGLPTSNSMWADLGDAAYALGGTAESNAHAGRASEAKIRAFLDRVTK